jgi:hypothetical protein
MSTANVGMHEAAFVPKSPEQTFVEGVVEIGLDAYSYIYYNRSELVPPHRGLIKHHKETELHQFALLVPLADKAMAIEILGGKYQEPEEAVGKLTPEYNDHAALALYRTGDRLGANLYLDDQLDKKSVIEELATLAGLGDQSAADILPGTIGPDDESKVFEVADRVIRTAYGSDEAELMVDIRGLTGLIEGPGATIGKHHKQHFSQGDLVQYFTEIKYGAASQGWESFVEMCEASRYATRFTNVISPLTRVRMYELHVDAARFYDMPEDQKEALDLHFRIDYDNFSDELKASVRPSIERVLDLLPFNPKAAYPDVIREYEKLTPEVQQEYRALMAVRIGQAGHFTEAMHYLKKLPHAAQVKVAYEIATFYYDKGLRFEMPQPAELRAIDPEVAVALGHLGADSILDQPRVHVFEYRDRNAKDEIIASIRADIEVARSSGDGHFISTSLQNAKLKAMKLGYDRETYDALHEIRDEEQAQAARHLSTIPENLPSYEEWKVLLQNKDLSWLHGFQKPIEVKAQKS